MRRAFLLLAAAALFALTLAGCSAVTYEYTSSPEISRSAGDRFAVSFSPEKERGEFYTWFKLDVTNTSQAPIEIDWTRTRYVLDGKNRGGFVWAGIDPVQIKNNTIPNDVIQPGQVFSKQISPLAKVALAERKDYAAGKDKPGLYGGILPAGENAISLVIKADGELIQQRLVVVIAETQKTK